MGFTTRTLGLVVRHLNSLRLFMVINLFQGQVAVVSWFPQHNAWNHSGYNVGHWNQECEAWFLKRRGCILDGVEGIPMSSKSWRDRLKMARAAAKILYRIDSAALDYLQSPLALPLIYTP